MAVRRAGSAEVVDVARLEAGRMELRRTHLDLFALARTCAEQAEALGSAHTVRVEGPPRAVLGWWDRDRIGQVLQNLLLNAVKYTPEGGEIVVRLEELAREARISVIDQGPGIARDSLARVFERFYRSETAVVSDVRGLGLGLYVTKSLVEAHGGRIWAESEGQGCGSVFTFTLPYGGNAGEGSSTP